MRDEIQHRDVSQSKYISRAMSVNKLKLRVSKCLVREGL